MGARATMITNAPLQLNGVALTDAYVTIGTLSNRIVTRYVQNRKMKCSNCVIYTSCNYRYCDFFDLIPLLMSFIES